jgi:hypothetical protein
VFPSAWALFDPDETSTGDQLAVGSEIDPAPDSKLAWNGTVDLVRLAGTNGEEEVVAVTLHERVCLVVGLDRHGHRIASSTPGSGRPPGLAERRHRGVRLSEFFETFRCYFACEPLSFRSALLFPVFWIWRRFTLAHRQDPVIK